MRKVREFFSDWNGFEKGYVIIGVILLTVTEALFPGGLRQYVCSLSLMLSAILLAKGKVESHIFAIIYSITYIMISMKQRYYGEVIMSLCVYLPVSIFALINWLRHLRHQDHTVAIQQLSKKELLAAFGSQILLSFVYYAFLKYFNTANIIISVISVIFSILACYFEARISVWSLYCFITNDIITIILWLIPLLAGEKQLASILIGPLMITVSDIYGVFNWHRLHQQQKENPD